MVAVGVRVAVQVMPPSVVVKFERAALGASRSAVVKPVTASEKTRVTVAVSPIMRAESDRVKELTAGAVVSIGAVVSMTIALLLPRDPDAAGAARVKIALKPEAFRIMPLLRASADVEM